MAKKIMITGGAGFIGSNLIRYLLENTDHQILNVDKLTYAGNLESLADVAANRRYHFVQSDIVDADELRRLFEFSPDAVIHLAAESHVDRSIDGPVQFIQTNIVGTFNLLQCAATHFDSLSTDRKKDFRFLHVSTDEVYGSLGIDEPPFLESTRYDPHSPYAASKASADHLVRAWSTTYRLPILITNCSNNYGPYQFPEKLVPVVILNAIRGNRIPVYGTGDNIRDWLYVGDHVKALNVVLDRGTPGETYNIGGDNQRSNITLVRMICQILDEELPVETNPRLDRSDCRSISKYEDLIALVPDRPGHDFRYAIDATKIRKQLGWEPAQDIESGFRETVRWYLKNESWLERVCSEEYRSDR